MLEQRRQGGRGGQDADRLAARLTAARRKSSADAVSTRAGVAQHRLGPAPKLSIHQLIIWLSDDSGIRSAVGCSASIRRCGGGPGNSIRPDG